MTAEISIYYGRELMFHRMYKKGAEVLEDFSNARMDGWKTG